MKRKELTKYLYKGNKLSYCFLTFASILETIFMMLISIMLERLLAIATDGTLDQLKEQLYIVIGVFVGMSLTYLCLYFIKPKYKKKALHQFKSNAYNLILNKNIESFNAHETSLYTSAFTNDINYISENYIFSTFTIITNILLLISAIAVMILYSPILTVVAIAFSFIPLILALMVGSKLSSHEEKISNANASFMHYIKDNFIGYSTIKIFKAEKKMKELYQKNDYALEATKEQKERTVIKIEFVQNATSLIAQVGVFLVGAYMAITSDKINASTILLFVQLMNYILSPIMVLPSLISKRRACNPLFDKMCNLVTSDTSLEKEKLVFNNQIDIENLYFAYEENKPILKGVNIKIEKNKSYAIVGQSGSGKSTFINLLLGRNLNYQGNIKFDGIDLINISIDSLYEITSVIEQNVFVFDDSILNNITMYESIDEDILKNIIVMSGLEKLVFEKGIEYKCGENGCNLSGGEKQRIAIARGLVKKAKLMFLDEITSALDRETSNQIVSNILNLENITKIMITHNLDQQILSRFDQILVFRNGQIIETGTFDQLIELNGIFKSLYELSE